MTSDNPCMDRGRWLVAVALAVALSGAAEGLENPIFATTFDRPAAVSGWTWQADEADADAAPDAQEDGVLTITNGAWQGPLVPVVAQHYYEVRMRAKSISTGLWAVTFTADGRDVPSDHYSVYAGGDWQTHVICVRARHGADKLRVVLRAPDDIGPLVVDDVAVCQVAPEHVRQWLATVARTVPPVTWEPPAGCLEHLPKTVAAWRAGTPLRVVQLGDSIVNDLGNSHWPLLLHEAYPKANIELVLAVRGGTGCSAYQRPAMFDRYVTAHRPDLVIIGGISHACDHRALEAVVRQVREKTGAEILILTGAVGPYAVPAAKGGIPEVVYRQRVRTYGERAAEVAARHGAAFLDLRTTWDQYIAGCGEPERAFLRDPVHANDRGRAVLAEIMRRFFSHDTPKSGGPAETP